MEDKLQELYKNISGEYDLPDFPTFQKDMQDPVKLGKLHKTLTDDNYEVPDFNTFQSDLFPAAPEGAKKKSTSLISRWWRGARDRFRRYS